MAILLLGLYSVQLSAGTYNSKCPQWEAGKVVFYNGVQLNTPSTSPSAFCWDATRIEGFTIYNGVEYSSELLTSNVSLANWYSGIKPNVTYYVYGENHYGIFVTVAVMGIPQSVPTVKLNSTIGILISTSNITSPSNNILNGKEYKFFIRKIPVSQAISLPDVDVNGNLEVYNGATLKDTTYIK